MNLNLYNDLLIKVQSDYVSSIFENDFKIILPELFLIIITISLLVYGVIYSTSKKKNYPTLLVNISWLCLISYVYTLLLLLNNTITNSVIFYNTLIIDDFSLLFKVLIICGAFFSILISIDYIKKEALNAFEYVILIMLATCSMLLLVSSLDFISVYLTIELQSLCFYVIAAFKRNSEFSTEAGIKYFILGAFSSGLLLFGCSLIYGFTGTTNFPQLAKIFLCGNQEIWLGIYSLRACELGMIFILVGFLFKVTAVPFHMWAPDVYEGAPTSVTAFFTITPKIAFLGVFLRVFLESFYNFMLPWQKVLIFCSIGSMIVGSLAAMSQNKIKRFLAFSSIGHIGFILIGFSCGTIEGLQALLIYLVVYIAMNINIFAIILSPARRDNVNSVQRIKYITDLAMLGKTNPMVAITLTIILFSMAGIPPLAGFYSKAFLFFAAVSSNMYVLAIIGVLSSVVSCFYYIRIIKIMYFEKSKSWCSFYQFSKENSLSLAISFFFVLFFMSYPSPLFYLTHKVALTLCI